jgi:hypothetical protein
MNRLIDARCKRCSRTVSTAVRSPLGLDRLKARWGVICQSCITPEEQRQMLIEQRQMLIEQGEAIAVRKAWLLEG